MEELKSSWQSGAGEGYEWLNFGQEITTYKGDNAIRRIKNVNVNQIEIINY